MNNLSLNLLTFPLWWYSTGTRILWQWAGRNLRYGLQQTGLLLFAKHMKEPLYGDYTKSGVVISFFLRLVILTFKLAIFGLRIFYVAVCILLYWLSLPATLSIIIYQIFAF